MKRYSEYKRLNVPWITKIPKHWDIKKINSIFEECKQKVSDKVYEPLSVTKKGITKQLENVAKTNNGDNRKKVEIGNFVINSRSDRKGSSGVSSYNGSVSVINIVLKIRKEYPRYIHYLMRSIPFQEEFYRNGKGIVADLWSTNYQAMKNIMLPIPPLEEQYRISNYLDWKIPKIENLIEVEQKKIKLYNELREKKLNSIINTELENIKNMYSKDEKNQKLKKIKIKYIARLYGRIGWQGLTSAEYSDEGVLLVTGTDFKDGNIDFDSCVRVPEFRWEQNKNIQLRNDDLLITKDGTVGKVAIVKNLGEKATLNSGIMKIEFTNKSVVTKEFLYYIIKSDVFKKWFIDLNPGVATIIHLYQKDFYNFEFYYPPIDIQNKIVDSIKKAEDLFNRAISISEKRIETLKMLENSIIANAVLGALDLRDMIIPEERK